MKTKQWFYQIYAIPGIIGCIDVTHLYMQRPRENEQLYFNRKGKHSLNAMIVCDHKMRIIAINSKYTGSAHDSLVWKHSNERASLANSFNEHGHNYWLLGDSGYPLERWLLTPYRSSNDPQNTYFNDEHAKARNILERTIVIYKGRWQILMEERKSRYDPIKLALFSNVCAALHNVCTHHNMEKSLFQNEQSDVSVETSNGMTNISNNRIKQVAEKIRDDIRDSLFA